MTHGNIWVSGWSWKEVAPYYQKFQSILVLDEETKHALRLHYLDDQRTPSSGALQTSFPLQATPLQVAWVETYKALGCAVKEDPVQGKAVGGLTITNAIDSNRGERSHAGVAYLKPALDQSNLEIDKDNLVE